MFKSLKNAIMNLYGQYELIFCICLFEPWEKRLINSVVLVILSLFIFSSYVYLPTYIQTFLNFISPLSTDSNGKTSYPPILQNENINIR